MSRRFSVRRHIQAQPELVWRLLTDAAGYRHWNPSIVRIGGEMTPGSTVRLVSTVNPKRTFALSVTACEAPRTMTWSDGMPLGLFTGERTFTLTPAAGGTDFEMIETHRGPLAGLITRAIPDMTESFEQYADGLKAAAERDASDQRA